MQMRKFGKLGIEGSGFGVGCMRFPTIEKDGQTQVDIDQAVAIIRAAIDGGCNYLDTAYVYHDQKSEEIVGLAIRDGYREKTRIATKLPSWMCRTPEDLPRYFEEQRRRLGVDCIDFYLVHALNRAEWDKMKELGVKEFLDDLQKEGKIKYKAFSFHDDYDAFEYILNDYDWDMCQIQLNLMDINHQAGMRGLRLAGALGIPVVIMEGLLGGSLASAPDNVQALYDAFPIKRSPAEWAFRFLLHQPEVACILSGVSTMEQTLDNLRIFDQTSAGCMSGEELTLMENVRLAYLARQKVGCTGCAYCMPCPAGVDIPKIFKTWNELFRFNKPLAGNGRYRGMIDKENDASRCVSCGQCESACPQHLPIRDLLKKAHGEMC